MSNTSSTPFHIQGPLSILPHLDIQPVILQCLDGSKEGSDYVVLYDQIYFGRSNKCHVQFTNLFVSTYHATLTIYQDGEILLRDTR